MAWDLDTTGRRLLDEICQIGAFTKEGGPLKVVPAAEKPKKKQEGQQEGGEEEEDEDEDAVAKAKEDERKGGRSFAQYVMPYKNPNPGARKSFGIRVVNIGRYRMLKDMESGKILKTKSEISALTDFIAWLKQVKADSGKDMVLLTCHEPNRKVLVPLLLESLRKYSLVDEFKAVVAGFANGIHVVGKYGDKDKVKCCAVNLRA